MADIFDKATRSRIMRAIKSRGTGPELALAAALRRFRSCPAYVFVSRSAKASRRLPGSPDFLVHNSYTAGKIAVFVHGCYWHLCPRHYKPPSGAAWRRKMDANRRRDVRVRRHLRARGWRTMVVWEHEDMSRAAARVIRRAAAA